MSISLFLLLGCEKELYEDSIKNNERSITIKEATLKELLKNPIFNTAYSKVKSKTLELKNTNARTALEDQYNFTITDDDILVMETNDSIKSYTFLIERETVTTDYFENLVIQIDSTGDIDALIMKYTPSSPDLTNFEGTKEVTPLVQSGRVYYFSNGCVMTTWTTCSDLRNDSAHPEWASVHIAGAGCNNPNYFNYYSSIVCPNENGGGGGDPTPTPTDDDPTIDGGSGGSVITNPNPPNNAVSKNFIKNLATQNPTRYSCYANSLPDFKAAITAFLDGNSPELSADDETIAGTQSPKEQFANEAIDANCNGGEVDFPNRVILDSSFIASPKIKCVYDKLIKSTNENFFKKMIQKFSNSTNKTLIFKVGDVPNGEYAITGGFPGNPNKYMITIHPDVNNLSNLYIMNLFCHELIHAFMFDNLQDSNLISFSVANGFPQLNPLALNCAGYAGTNINSLTASQVYEYALCLLTTNGLASHFSHDLFNMTNYTTNTYQETLYQFLLNQHNWDGETLEFKTHAIDIFGISNWKKEVAKAVSWIGLNQTLEYQNYINTYPIGSTKREYINNIEVNLFSANKICP